MVKNLKRYRKQLEREMGKFEAQKYPFVIIRYFSYVLTERDSVFNFIKLILILIIFIILDSKIPI